MDNKDLRVNELCGTVIELSMKRRIFGIGNEETNWVSVFEGDGDPFAIE